MTRRQLARLVKKHGLTKWQHRAAQILFSINGSEAAKKYVEALVVGGAC